MEQRPAKLAATIDSLPTLDDFYSTLEAAKENHPYSPFPFNGNLGCADRQTFLSRQRGVT